MKQLFAGPEMVSGPTVFWIQQIAACLGLYLCGVGNILFAHLLPRGMVESLARIGAGNVTGLFDLVIVFFAGYYISALTDRGLACAAWTWVAPSVFLCVAYLSEASRAGFTEASEVFFAVNNYDGEGWAILVFTAPFLSSLFYSLGAVVRRHCSRRQLTFSKKGTLAGVEGDGGVVRPSPSGGQAQE